MSTCQIPLLTLVIFALPSSVFQQLPCSAFPAQERVRYMDQAQSPWQFFQKRLLQLLFIQCLGLDKLYREQCQSVRLNPIFNSSHSSSSGPVSAFGSILYRSGMNKKIGRNFEVFTPCDFIAAITQHIPDKSFQLVRYYGWYSNKMRGRRAKQADEEVQTEGDAVEVIDISAHEPRRIPSKKSRKLIKKVWEADPLRCPKCSREMRIVSLIDQEDVIERILRHLGLWQEGGACIPAPTRRAKRPSIRGSTTPSPTTTPNRSWRSPPPETSGSARVRLSHPLFSGPQPSGGSFFGMRARPATRKSPSLTSGPIFVTLRSWKRTLSASDSGPTPRRAKSDFLSVRPINPAGSFWHCLLAMYQNPAIQGLIP